MRKRPAADVKAHWSEIVDEVNSVGEVLVMEDDRPEVVVVSMDRYTKLRQEAMAGDPLAALRGEIDEELAVLRGPQASRKLRKAFASAPTTVARVANAPVRRKR